MRRKIRNTAIAVVFFSGSATAGQVPGPAAAPDTPISSRDRVYAAEQFSNTVSVVDPAQNALLGVIRLGDPQPGNFSPLYRGQVLVHGMGVSPDHKTLAVVSIGSNGVSFIDTATNEVKHTTYVGRSPHEAFFTPDGKEVWVTVRGENYVSVLDTVTFEETARITTAGGPGMSIFSPDGHLGYVCSSFNPQLTVVDVQAHKVLAAVAQPSPFCPNIAATPDGDQVWYTLKDVGKVVAINARSPYNTLKILDTGPITNHVNFVDNANGHFAYVTVGGLDEVQVFRRDDFSKVATIPVGKLPHGLWPSGDGSRIYIGLENGDGLAVLDTLTNALVKTIPIGQAPQALIYVPEAVPQGEGRSGLTTLGVAGEAAQVILKARGAADGEPTSVTLFEQGLIQVLQAAVTGLQPGSHYVLGLAKQPDGAGPIESLATFTTNAAGSAIVNATGPLRQLVQGPHSEVRWYLVVAPGTPGQMGEPVQIQAR